MGGDGARLGRARLWRCGDGDGERGDGERGDGERGGGDRGDDSGDDVEVGSSGSEARGCSGAARARLGRGGLRRPKGAARARRMTAAQAAYLRGAQAIHTIG
jgi:hypothetical protein